MKQLCWKTTLYASLLLGAFTVAHVSSAQNRASSTTTSDEQTIRNLVAQENEGQQVIQTTDNHIFVSGAYPRPLIGKQRNAEDQQRADNIKSKRQNFTQKSRIERLEVAQAGDMAYEFGYSDLSWDTPKKKHIAFEASYVRVWRKIDGSWEVDVFFARPNDAPAKM